MVPIIGAAGIVLLSQPSAFAQVKRRGRAAAVSTTPFAVPNQIVIHVPDTMSDADVATLANSANCTVLAKIPYTEHFYVLELTSAVTTSKAAAVHRGRVESASVSSDVLAAATLLHQTPGVAAQPNYVNRFQPTRSDTTPAKGTARAASTSANGTLGRWGDDPLYYPSPVTSAGQRWNLEMIHMPQAWAIQTNALGRDVVVAVIDTGIDATHPDFVRADGTNVILSTSEDFTPLIADPTASPTVGSTDAIGHGTNVAGIIGAAGNNAIGVTGVAGEPYNSVKVDILGIRLFDANSDATEAEFIATLAYAVAQNVDVINLSLGGAQNFVYDATNDPDSTEIADAIAAGITVVASAGNDGTDYSTPLYYDYPAEYPGVISVAAIGPERELSSFSNYGSGITLGAPGGDDLTFANPAAQILSTFPITSTQNGFVDAGYQASPIKGYATVQGTSQAAPHVTGAVALLLAAGASRTPATISAILTSTAQNIASNIADPLGGTVEGAGLLDVYAAVASVTTKSPGFTAQFAEVMDNYYAPTGSINNSTTTAGYTLITNEPYTTRGDLYTRPITPFTIRYVGIPQTSTGTFTPGYVSVRITPATTPTTSVVTYTGAGTNGTSSFAVLSAIPSGDSAATTLLATVPGTGNLTLTSNVEYRAALEVTDPTTGTTTEEGAIFFTPVAETLTAGRYMFASPFLVSSSVIGALPAEIYEFGAATSFQLARYNAQRSSTDTEYAIYSPLPNGTQNTQAEFAAPLAADGTPLTYFGSDPTTSIAPIGLGYWLDLTTSTVTLNPTGSIASDSVYVKLFDTNGGWNMVGDPYTYPINWSAATVISSSGTSYSLDDAVTAGIISPALIGYADGDYVLSVEPNGVLNPFSGYWVQALQNCTLVLTASPSTRSVAAHTRAATAVTGSQLPAVHGWRGRFMASVSGDRDAQNYFGIDSGSATAITRENILKPPTGAGHAYTRFVKADASGKTAWYAVDMRSESDVSDTAEWTAAVSTDKADSSVTLSWDGLGALDHTHTLTLTDSVTKQSISMRARSSYTFHSGEAGSTRSFTIRESQGLSAGPFAVTNFSVVPGSRALHSVGFQFITNQAADYTAQIKAINGRVIADIGGGTRAEATTQTLLHWSGKKNDGTAAPAGLYFVEIVLTNANGERVTVKRPFTSLF